MSLDINFRVVDKKMNSALHMATRNGNTKMAFKILLKNPDFKQLNANNESPLSMAKKYEFYNIEALFVRKAF